MMCWKMQLKIFCFNIISHQLNKELQIIQYFFIHCIILLTLDQFFMRSSKKSIALQQGSYILNPNIVSHLQPRSWGSKNTKRQKLLYRKTLKERFVVFAFTKLLQRAKQHQIRILENMKGTKQLVGDDQKNVFLRGTMRKRVVNNNIKRKSFFTTIQPTSSYLRSLREMMREIQDLVDVFSNKGSLIVYRKRFVEKEHKTSRVENMSTGSGGTHRSRDRLNTLESVPEEIDQIERKQSGFLENRIEIQKNAEKIERSISNRYMLKMINREVSTISQHKQEYEQMTMKNILRTLLQKINVGRTDLFTIQSWLKHLQPLQISTMTQILSQINHSIAILTRKLQGTILQDYQKKLRSCKSQYKPASPRNNSTLSSFLCKSLSEEFFNFRELQSELIYLIERYLYPEASSPKIIITSIYKSLLNLSSHIRYYLGFLHKEIQQILEKLDNQRLSTAIDQNSLGNEQIKVQTKRAMNFAKSMKKKYNMDFQSNFIWAELQKAKSVYYRLNTNEKQNDPSYQ